MRRLLILLLIVGSIVGQTGTGAVALFSDSDQSTDNTFNAWIPWLWTQTTQADFDAGVLNQVNTSLSPGDVLLGTTVTPHSVNDTFIDESKIASRTNLVVTGGQVVLTGGAGASGTETLRPDGAGVFSMSDPVGEASSYLCVDEVSADDDTTYVETSGGDTELDTYNINNHSQGTGTINSVTVYASSKGTSGATSAPELVGSWSGATDFDTNGFTYSPAAGTNRLVLVMVTSESDSNPIANVNQVTLGGQALTPIENPDGVVVGSAGSYHNNLWFGYLDEARISNMSGNALNVSWDTAPANSPPVMVQAATYQFVNQLNPIADSASNTDTSARSIRAGSIDVGENDRVVYATVCGSPQNHSATNGYSEQLEQDGPGNSHSHATAQRDGTTSDTENPTARWNANERLAIITAVLNGFEGSSEMAAEVAIRTYGTNYYGGYTASLPTSYTGISATWTDNPNTGNPWTWPEIDALEAGVMQYDLSYGEVRTTQVYVEVNYSSGITYDSPGTLTSTNLLSGQTVASISSFRYNSSAIPAETTLRVQFSQDSSNWYNSSGAADGWDALSQGTNMIDLSTLGWSGSNFYYRMEFTSTGAFTPVLDEIEVYFSRYSYYASGSIASPVYDTTIAGATWDLISWNETLQANTDITIEVRASDTLFAEGDPTPAWTPVGGTSPVTSGLPSGRYVQWRASLSSSDTSITPVLHEVNVEYY